MSLILMPSKIITTTGLLLMWHWHLAAKGHQNTGVSDVLPKLKESLWSLRLTLICYISFMSTAADAEVDTTQKQLVGNKDMQSNTVLHMAAWNNDVKTADLCLDHGSDVNTRKTKETTPLHIAATKGNLEMAELLISRGAGVNIKDGDSKTPLHRYFIKWI